MTTSTARSFDTNPALVLSEATTNAARTLGLNIHKLATILGVSDSRVKQLRAGAPLDPASKVGEIAMLFIRVYRSVFVLNGGDPENMMHWLKTDNLHLNGIPLELMEKTEGMVRTCWYLDAMRGHA